MIDLTIPQQFGQKLPQGKTNKRSALEYRAIRYQRHDSIKQQIVDGEKFTIQTDIKFLQSIKEIAKTQQSVLQELKSLKNSNLTNNQCEEIHFKAKRHFDANKFNINSNLSKNDITQNPSLQHYFCLCGCNKFKGESYFINTKFEDISSLGSGIILYFYLVKMLIINMFIFLVIYSLFSLATNLLQTNPIQDNKCLDSAYCNFRNNASDRSKFDDDTLNFIEQWLGVAGMLIVMILTRYVKIIGYYKDKFIDKNLTSASDFTLKFNLLPDGQYNQEDLLQYIQKLTQEQLRLDYTQKIRKESEEEINGMIKDMFQKQVKENKNVSEHQMTDMIINAEISNKMAKLFEQKLAEKVNDVIANLAQQKGVKSVQIIYNMQFSRKVLSKLIICSYAIKSMIKYKNSKAYIANKHQYQLKKSELIQTYEIFQDLRKKFLSDKNFRKKLSTKFAVVQFYREEEKKYFLEHFGSQNVTFYKYFKEHLINKCFGSNSKLIFKGKIPEIITAPEPTDIIWINCEKKQSILRIILIYFVTFIIILMSLGIMVGLSYLKVYVLNKQASQIPGSFTKESLATFINIMITVCLQIINALLWILLQALLELEYNHTHTNKIISQMNKSVIAVCINIIALPILVNVFINNYSYYGAEGLSSIVYDYHVSAIAIGLLVKFLDPAFLFIKMVINIKGLRNYFIKARYSKKRSEDKIEEEQMKKIYAFYQAPEFVIAESYTFIISNVLHAVFFASLQPILIIFAFIQVFLFFWICKYRVLKECKIPKLTEKLVFDVAIYQIMLIPAFFGGGSLVNSYVIHHIYPNRQAYILAPIICMCLGALNYSNPGNLLGKITQFAIKNCCALKDELSDNNTSKNVRVDNYYKNSNSLTLFGFEKCLLGNTNTQNIQKELKNYCCGHRKDIIEMDTFLMQIDENEESSREQFDNYQSQDVST